jgi:hypothetical protein
MRRAAVACLLGLCLGCGPRESPEAARDRAAESFLKAQIADTKRLIARLESGERITQDRIAIGISESVVKQIIDTTLPPEIVLGKEFRLRLESVQPIFRGTKAGLLFQAEARGATLENLTARVELAGSLERFRLDGATLTADVEVVHFKVLDTSLGAAPAGLLERLIGDNLQALNDAIPGLKVPVHLEESVEIGGLDEGVVMARAGALPLVVTVAEVIPSGQRLWVLLDAKAGPWQPRGAAEAKTKPGVSPPEPAAGSPKPSAAPPKPGAAPAEPSVATPKASVAPPKPKASATPPETRP